MATVACVHDLAMFGHVALAALFGFVIGWEREVRGHPAGSRTFALVSTGSAALTTISVNVFTANPDRLLAGVVTGVGFIGAGIVLRDPRGHVQGLTTAAAVWATTAVGLIVGTGGFVFGGLTAALYLAVLEFRCIPVLGRLDASRWTHRFVSDPSAPEKE